MKVYYLQTQNVIPEVSASIVDSLKRLGCTVKEREKVSESDTYNFDNARKTFNENVKNIKNADIVVAECSYHSNGLGYEVSVALEEKKPVIALYNLSIDKDHPRHIKNIPASLKGNTSKYLILKDFDLRILHKILELAINDAKALVDTKFILIIPPVIDRYLEWNVREKGLSKAEVTREAIEKMMGEDKRYQDYLKSSGLAE